MLYIEKYYIILILYPPIIGRCYIKEGLKGLAEIHRGVKTAFQGNLRYAFLGVMKKTAGFLDFQDIDILDYRISGQLFKGAAQMARGYIKGRGDFFNAA